MNLFNINRLLVGMVQKLKLNFACPDDYKRIVDFFRSDRKEQADPNKYIYKRKREYFENSLSTRSAAFITDISTDEIVYYTSTYKMYDGEVNPNQRHTYTEAGTSISLIPGYGSTSFVASLLMLKEWLYDPPEKFMVARTKQENKAAIMARGKIMGWDIVKDENLIHELIECCDRSCRSEYVGESSNNTLWFYMQGELAIQKEANLALRVIERGALINKYEEIMPIDYSVIDEVGLSEGKLRAMARGEFDREKLLEF